MPRGDHKLGQNNSRRINLLHGTKNCPTCGQPLPDGPEAFVLQGIKHGLGGYAKGCRCEYCILSYRVYSRNYARNRYRKKKSKSGMFDPNGLPTGLPQARDPKTGRLIKMVKDA